MEKGKATQQIIERLEARRKLKKYGLQKGTRRFNTWMTSENLGLSGKVDMLIETQDRVYPVDFKFTRGRPYKNHVYQLAGYSLILEDIQSKPVTQGFVYLILQEDVVVFDMKEKIKEECRALLEEIRGMIQEERFPEPPSSRAKCTDCEYQNYCRDVW
jgi:CRISPR-associated exonuclease Cas4